MIIDFHTHIFPDKIAARSVKAILDKVPGAKAFNDGTISSLKERMLASGVDKSVLLSVATSPRQCKTINEFLYSIPDENMFIKFGAVHPGSADYKEILNNISLKGFKGIKLHPQYQNTKVNAPEMINIVRYAASLGLIILIHGGFDIGFPGLDLCSPQDSADLLDHVPEARVVLAHFGAWKQWNDVKQYLLGRDVFLDTSTSIYDGPEDLSLIEAEEIIKIHGAEKILFATDSPWDSHTDIIKKINALNITEEEKNMIFSGNAIKLLGL